MLIHPDARRNYRCGAAITKFDRRAWHPGTKPDSASISRRRRRYEACQRRKRSVIERKSLDHDALIVSSKTPGSIRMMAPATATLSPASQRFVAGG